MKKAIRGMREFLQVINYCIGILWKTSRKYFIIRIILNIVSLAAPFAVITITRSLILIFSLLLLGLNILSKGIETVSAYYAGLHRDTVDTATKQLIMEKASKLDLSFFDSAAFYNEVSDADSNSPLITFSAFQAMDFIRYFVQFVIAFGYLFQFSVILPAIFAVSAIPSTVAQIKQVEAIYGFQREYLGEQRKMQYASDILLSREFAKDVRIYNIYPFISGKFRNIWKMLFSKKKKISLRYTRILLALSTLPEIVAAVFLFLLGLSVVWGTYHRGLLIFAGNHDADVRQHVYGDFQLHAAGRRQDAHTELQEILRI